MIGSHPFLRSSWRRIGREPPPSGAIKTGLESARGAPCAEATPCPAE